MYLQKLRTASRFFFASVLSKFKSFWADRHLIYHKIKSFTSRIAKFIRWKPKHPVEQNQLKESFRNEQPTDSCTPKKLDINQEKQSDQNSSKKSSLVKKRNKPIKKKKNVLDPERMQFLARRYQQFILRNAQLRHLLQQKKQNIFWRLMDEFRVNKRKGEIRILKKEIFQNQKQFQQYVEKQLYFEDDSSCIQPYNPFQSQKEENHVEQNLSQGFAQDPSQAIRQDPSQVIEPHPSQVVEQHPSQAVQQELSQKIKQDPSYVFEQDSFQVFEQDLCQADEQYSSKAVEYDPFQAVDRDLPQVFDWEA